MGIRGNSRHRHASTRRKSVSQQYLELGVRDQRPMFAVAPADQLAPVPDPAPFHRHTHHAVIPTVVGCTPRRVGTPIHLQFGKHFTEACHFFYVPSPNVPSLRPNRVKMMAEIGRFHVRAAPLPRGKTRNPRAALDKRRPQKKSAGISPGTLPSKNGFDYAAICFLPPSWPIAILRGFIASGTRRIRSITSKPFSSLAFSTSTKSARRNWRLNGRPAMPRCR